MTTPHNQPLKTAEARLINVSIWPFMLMTFAISWGCWFLLALTRRDAFQDLEMGLLLVLGGFGPAIAGVWLVQRSGDATLIGDYWRRVFGWRRIGWLWYAPILLLYPTAVLLAHLINGTSPDFSPLQTLLQEPAYLTAVLIFVFFFGPFSEELGWRG